MTLQRWELVYNELQARAQELGYKPPKQLGSGQSQVFEFKIGGDPVLLLAFRDLARKKDYKVSNRLWAEGLDIVLQRFEELAAQGKPKPRAAAIVIDNKANTFVVVMMDELLELYHQKDALGSDDGHRRLTFVIQREGKQYSLQMPAGRPPIPLTSVNSVESLILLLKSKKRFRRIRHPLARLTCGQLAARCEAAKRAVDLSNVFVVVPSHCRRESVRFEFMGRSNTQSEPRLLGLDAT